MGSPMTPIVSITTNTAHATTTSEPLPPKTATYLPTFTPNPSSVPLSTTPIPTLAPTQREAYWLDLISTNRGCKLPCWWGIRPGESPSQELLQFSAAEGFQNLPHKEGDTYILMPTLDDPGVVYILAGFHAENDFIHAISVDVDLLNANPSLVRAMRRYALEQVLGDYGEPSQVLLRMTSHPTEPNDPWPYQLSIFFDDLGILISYEGTGLSHRGSNIRVCPRYETVQVIRLYLRPPASGETLKDFAKSFGWDIEKTMVGAAHYLEEATDLSVGEFRALFVQPDGPGCFETPRDIW